MPFIPHTESEIDEMLAAIGAADIEALFDEIPAGLRVDKIDLSPALSEMEVGRLMAERATQDGTPLCFAGGGAYQHHIPAAVWQLATRGEYYSAYTPYQAEASQGTLQTIYEYQTMVSRLTGMDISNASLYDGASALAEAVLMAVRANRKSKSRRILVPRAAHPAYRQVLQAIVSLQQIEIVEIPFDPETGCTDIAAYQALAGDDVTAVVVTQPNYFGILEEVDPVTDWAHSEGALVIGLVNPTALALIKPPGTWGDQGADIVCGDGQPLGIPLSSGGPYFGFMCCRKSLVRQMPGRLVGRTSDLDGKPGFTLTLQAREQHIRRAKATSNICTNQGLMVTAATIYMALMGPNGLQRVASASHSNTVQLVSQLCKIEGVSVLFDGPFFHECALRLPVPAGEVIEALAKQKIIAGIAVQADYEELSDVILVCATETKSAADMALFAEALNGAVQHG